MYLYSISYGQISIQHKHISIYDIIIKRSVYKAVNRDKTEF